VIDELNDQYHRESPDQQDAKRCRYKADFEKGTVEALSLIGKLQVAPLCLLINVYWVSP